MPRSVVKEREGEGERWRRRRKRQFIREREREREREVSLPSISQSASLTEPFIVPQLAPEGNEKSKGREMREEVTTRDRMKGDGRENDMVQVRRKDRASERRRDAHMFYIESGRERERERRQRREREREREEREIPGAGGSWWPCLSRRTSFMSDAFQWNDSKERGRVCTS